MLQAHNTSYIANNSSECIYLPEIVEYSLCNVNGSSTFCNTAAHQESPFPWKQQQ